MKDSKFIKALTLMSFIFLISAFVAYRSGTFSEMEAESLSTDRSKIQVVDSPPQRPTIFPSSKSGDIVRPLENNSQVNEQQQNNPTNQSASPAQSKPSVKKDSTRKKTMMGSSKSGRIIDPVIMGSSKSAPVFIPKKDTAKKED